MTNIKLSILSLVAALSLSQGVQASAAPTTSKRLANISSAIIPSGFDQSSPTAIVNGFFPNSCYSWDSSEVTHVSTFVHQVRSFAKVQAGMCLMVIIPFSEEVPLGKFATGTHKIQFMTGEDNWIEKELVVE